MKLVELDGRKILVIVYGHVADTMAAVPALRSLRVAYPSASIHVLALESAAPILGPCPYIDELITWRDFQHKGERVARIEKAGVLAALAWKLRQSGYEATLVFHRSNGAMRKLAEWIGAPITYVAAPGPGVESSREENRRVLSALGVEEDGGALELWTKPEDAEWAAAFVRSGSGPLVGLHPGSDWSCQQWLPKRFAEVASALQTAIGARIVITGSSAETDLESEIAQGLAEDPLRACGQTTFGQFIEVIRRLDVLVCVNSAAAAVATAVGTPAVVLLGLEDARYTGVASGRTQTLIQPKVAAQGGGWCEFGRWGVLSGCNSPMCRGLGGLAAVAPAIVSTEVLNLLGRSKVESVAVSASQNGGTQAHEAGTPKRAPNQVPIG
jgi:ADP-heptose:LPS heptosyltransferase